MVEVIFIFMFDTYTKHKEYIIGNFKKIEEVTQEDNLKLRLKSIISNLNRNTFSLVVVGQFKRGKTTFINALLGEDILPTAIVPLTSIVTILHYGETLLIKVFSKDGVIQEIPLEDLKLYVTEKYNPKNEKNIDKVEIAYPSDYLRNGVQIIDTPGIASVYEHNTKATYEYLPKADAAIFLVSVDPPLTKAELDFLYDIKKQVVKVFFIQNKIDTVPKKDREESLDFTKNIIIKEVGFKNIHIYPLSAKIALEGKLENDKNKLEESGLELFEDSLNNFFMKEKGKLLLFSSARKALEIIEESLMIAELSKKSREFSIKELEDKITKFKLFISEIKQEKIDSERLLSSEMEDLEKNILKSDIEKLKNNKTKWLVTKVGVFAIAHKTDSNNEFVKSINGFIDKQIMNIFNEWRSSEEKILKSYLVKILSRFEDRMNSILNKILESASGIFGISQRTLDIKEEFPAQIDFRFQTKDESDLLEMTLNFGKVVLPKIIAHKIILKEAKNKAEMMIDRHCGKSRYDFSQRIGKLIDDYKETIGKVVGATENDILEVLERAVNRKEVDSSLALRDKESLDKKIKVLREVKENLEKNYGINTTK